MRTIDDHGHRVEVAAGDRTVLSPQHRFQQLAIHVTMPHRWEFWTHHGLFFLVMAYFILAAVKTHDHLQIMICSLTVIVYFSISIIMTGVCKAYLQYHVREMVEKHYCGSCMYPLHDIPVEPDGCQICPECAAAWKADAPDHDHHAIAHPNLIRA